MREVRQGIVRQPERHPAQRMPVTERQQQVLDAVDDVARGATEIGGRCALSARQVQSALYALQARGLVQRLGGYKGWTRA